MEGFINAKPDGLCGFVVIIFMEKAVMGQYEPNQLLHN